jgi:hypothetical protein
MVFWNPIHPLLSTQRQWIEPRPPSGESTTCPSSSVSTFPEDISRIIKVFPGHGTENEIDAPWCAGPSSSAIVDGAIVDGGVLGVYIVESSSVQFVIDWLSAQGRAIVTSSYLIEQMSGVMVVFLVVRLGVCLLVDQLYCAGWGLQTLGAITPASLRKRAVLGRHQHITWRARPLPEGSHVRAPFEYRRRPTLARARRSAPARRPDAPPGTSLATSATPLAISRTF